jgi:hypothetical protein
VRYRLILAAVFALLPSILSGCLATLGFDPVAQHLVFIPKPEFGLPQYEDRPHWLLHGQAGWCGAHEVRYGGDPGDPGVATVRAARFRDEESAAAGFSRLTPEYLSALLRDRVTGPPWPFEYGDPLPGDEVAVYEYGVRLPPVYSPDHFLPGQFSVVRAGSVIYLIETIGIPPERMSPAVLELVRGASRRPGPC